MADLSERQRRMLEAGTFHFDSGGDNRANFDAAWDLERRGLLTIRVNRYQQHATYDCTVLDAGRASLTEQSHDR